MNVEEGPVCREHGGSMYVCRGGGGSGSGCVTFQAADVFDREAWSHDRLTGRKHVKEPARLQQSDLKSLRAHDHRLKMMFFSRIERSAKD